MINFQYDQDVEYQAIREEERAEGRQEGRQEGMQEGERKKAIEMAKKFLELGTAKEIVVEASGLPLEVIEELEKLS